MWSCDSEGVRECGEGVGECGEGVRECVVI